MNGRRGRNCEWSEISNKKFEPSSFEIMNIKNVNNLDFGNQKT